MKRRIFSDIKKMYLSVLVIFTIIMFANGQNPKREVVFTLDTNEVIFEKEYYLLQSFNQHRFACMIQDTITKELTFVFNGRRIKKTDPFTHPNFIYSSKINLAKENGFVIWYKEKNQWYINYNGVIDGGFEDIYLCDNSVYPRAKISTPEKNYDYLYKLSGKWNACKNGKNKKIDVIEPYNVQENEWYVSINGYTINPSDPYDYVWNSTLTESGSFAYTYKKDGLWFINVNGNIIGGYENVYNLIYTNSEKIAYFFTENKKNYVNINGNIYGPYEGIGYHSLRLTDSGKYAYYYEANGKWHVNINGETSNGYGLIYNLILTENEKYGYCYTVNNKAYVNINGIISSDDFDYLAYFTLTEGEYAYWYREGIKWYANINGNITRNNIFFYKTFDDVFFDYDEVARSWAAPYYDIKELNSSNDEHLFRSTYQYEFVIIDGRPYGKAPAIQVDYDEKENAFIWTAIEGNELVVYEYKLD